MSTPEKPTKKGDRHTSQRTGKEIFVPFRYKDLPSDVVEELWTLPIFIDAEKNAQAQEEKRLALEQLRIREARREEGKQNEFQKQYTSLSPEEKKYFPEAQKEVATFIIDAIKGNISLEGMPLEERFLLSEVQSAYENHVATQPPGTRFPIKFSNDTQKNIWDNISYRLAFNMVHNHTRLQKHIENCAKIAALQDQIGIPRSSKTKIDIPEESSALPIETQRDTQTLNVHTLESIEKFTQEKKLLSQESYEESLDKAIESLRGTEGVVEIQHSDIPTIVLSDIHARSEFILHTLEQPISGGTETIHSLLKKGAINIVCLGDGMHSERGSHWETSTAIYALEDCKEGAPDTLKDAINKYQEVLEGIGGKPYVKMTPLEIYTAKKRTEATQKWNELGVEELLQKHLMNQEMARSLGAMKLIMELKAEYPETFHYIRGNHDDMGERVKGYFKYGNESADVKEWILENYGDDFLEKYKTFEDSLPLIVKHGDTYTMSHTVPSSVLSEEDIQQREKDTIESLTWTDNTRGDTEETVIRKTLTNLHAPRAKWIIGHRNVQEGSMYREQFDGTVIQINDDKRELIAVLRPDGSFDPDKDIYDVSTPS
jgi:hypothetical protein